MSLSKSLAPTRDVPQHDDSFTFNVTEQTFPNPQPPLCSEPEANKGSLSGDSGKHIEVSSLICVSPEEQGNSPRSRQDLAFCFLETPSRSLLREGANRFGT